MSHILCARFQLLDTASAAQLALTERGVPNDHIAIFYVTPPGQHAEFPIGGDRAESPEPEDLDGSHKGSVTAPEEVVNGKGKDVDPEEVRFRAAGIMLAVACDAIVSDATADMLRLLVELGGFDFEQSEGTIQNGDWPDFDPLSLPRALPAELDALCVHHQANRPGPLMAEA